MTDSDIANVCQAVGFNTIPSWLKPYHVLSNGEKFRVELAKRLIESDEMIIFDEFTSVVDRQVAKIASHAVQKYIRKNKKQFVAISCHYDVIDWLQPDWIYDTAHHTFQWRISVRPLGFAFGTAVFLPDCECVEETKRGRTMTDNAYNRREWRKVR